ncbi:MAG: ribosome silencing factor, partial [Bacteroidota bacterium]
AKKTAKKTAKKVEKKIAKKVAAKSVKKTIADKPAPKRQTKPKTVTLTVNDVIIESILEKKGERVTSIDFKKIPDTAARFFIICEADSTTQVRAIAYYVVEKTKEKLKEHAWHIEGTAQSEWVLIDYVSTVVHIFLKDKREFYQLEDLWSDGIVKEHKD